MQFSFEDVYLIAVGRLSEWLEQMILMLPNIMAAIVVVIIFYIFASFFKNFVITVLKRRSKDHAFLRLLSKAAAVLIFFFGIFIALSILKLDKTVTSLLAGAGILGLALGVALQDILANVISGIVLDLRKGFKIRDLISVDDNLGYVKEITLRTTLLESLDGQDIYIPNRDIFRNTLINHSANKMMRVGVDVGLTYDTDLRKVKKKIVKLVKGLSYRIENKEIEFYFTEFGASNIRMQVYFWVKFKRQEDFLEAKSDVILKIKEMFDKNNISIAYPVRTIDFFNKDKIQIKKG